MKLTVFNKIHREMGARMVEFAGHEMPLEYSGIVNEHLAVRNSVGVFDVSHMGEIFVKGPDAINLLQKITSNDVSRLKTGRAQYSCFPNGNGGIVDDLIIYKYEETINNTISQHKIIAICAYSLDKCGAPEIIEVTNNHGCALIMRKGRWTVIESSEQKRVKETK